MKLFFPLRKFEKLLCFLKTQCDGKKTTPTIGISFSLLIDFICNKKSFLFLRNIPKGTLVYICDTCIEKNTHVWS